MDTAGDESTDAATVEAAAAAAERVIADRLDAGDLEDVDIRVTLDDGELSIEVHLLPSPDADIDEDHLHRVADDAALAARGAADDAH